MHWYGDIIDLMQILIRQQHAAAFLVSKMEYMLPLLQELKIQTQNARETHRQYLIQNSWYISDLAH